MLSQQVLTEWNSLKEIIKGHYQTNQQYQWGQLLTNLGMRIVAPHLSLELVTNEIKATRSLDAKLEEIKREANRNIIVPIIREDIGGGLIRQQFDYSVWEKAFKSLRNMINKSCPHFSSDDESEPTIEEVE